MHIEAALDAVRRQQHAIAHCYVILEAVIPVAVMAGDLARAGRELDVLAALAEQHGLTIWQATGRCLRVALRAVGSEAVPSQEFGQALASLRADGYTAPAAWLCGLAAAAPGLRATAAAKRALVEEALAGCEASGEGWCAAEPMRVRAELIAADHDAAADDAAHVHLHAALRLVQEQGALAWELRAVTSLARLARPDRRGEACAVLASVIDRVAEGHATADVLAAMQALAAVA